MHLPICFCLLIQTWLLLYLKHFVGFMHWTIYQRNTTDVPSTRELRTFSLWSGGSEDEKITNRCLDWIILFFVSFYWRYLVTIRSKKLVGATVFLCSNLEWGEVTNTKWWHYSWLNFSSVGCISQAFCFNHGQLVTLVLCIQNYILY